MNYAPKLPAMAVSSPGGLEPENGFPASVELGQGERARSGIEDLEKPSTLAEAFGEICKMDAPLNERLAAYANALHDLNFPFSEAYDDLVARLKAGGIGAQAPLVGELMPPFQLPALPRRLVGACRRF